MHGTLVFSYEDISVFDRLASALRAGGFDVLWRSSLDEVYDLADEGAVDVAIVGLEVDGESGVELCRRIALTRPDVRVIVLSNEREYDSAVAALRAGAFDFLGSDVGIEVLEPAVHRALQQRALREEVRRLRTALNEATGFEELIGISPPMLRLYEYLEQAAASNASALITGESGTGKELVAKALHRRSKRRDGPFVAVNCSAIPENLLESELFGHVKGAFTDAKVARSGLFVKATGGTIFLDEIGEMPVALQPKLLRALQERVVRPVGGDVEVPFDARIIAATNRNLEAAVTDKTFREDLFYRINVIHIDVPPLRERASDIILLAQHYVEHFALLSEKAVVGISAPAADKLQAYPWPGNVREMQNCIERAVALTRHEEIRIEDLPEKVRKHRAAHVLVVSEDPSTLVSLEEVERRYIRRVVKAVGGNKKEASRILGLDRKTLYRKLQRWGDEST
jgi:two-component system response regulator HydG